MQWSEELLAGHTRPRRPSWRLRWVQVMLPAHWLCELDYSACSFRVFVIVFFWVLFVRLLGWFVFWDRVFSVALAVVELLLGSKVCPTTPNFFFFLLFWSKFSNVAQASLDLLMVLPSQPPKYRDDRCVVTMPSSETAFCFVTLGKLPPFFELFFPPDYI